MLGHAIDFEVVDAYYEIYEKLQKKNIKIGRFFN